MHQRPSSMANRMWKKKGKGTLRPLSGTATTNFHSVSRPVPDDQVPETALGFTLTKRSAPPPLGKSVFEFQPPFPTFGPINVGFTYQMSVLLRNISPNRERFRIVHTDVPNPANDETFTRTRCLSKPGQLAPGCAVNLELEIEAKEVGNSFTVIEIQSQHQTHFLEVTAHVLDSQTIATLQAELRAKNKPILARGVRACGPIKLARETGFSLTHFQSMSQYLRSDTFLMSSSTIQEQSSSDPLPKFKLKSPKAAQLEEKEHPETVDEMNSERRCDWLRQTSRRLEAFFGGSDLEDLHTVPIHPAMYWDPSKHKLCLDREQMGCILDGSLALEQAKQKWEVHLALRQKELEENDLITSKMIQSIRKFGFQQQEESSDDDSSISEDDKIDSSSSSDM
mmetsp:Transcript_21066/g.27679  ORF Transcript_21066/g.27679 Transcript_21066/m.27679 type:complete len:395 (+) Transcript_21066:178-1362(+)